MNKVFRYLLCLLICSLFIVGCGKKKKEPGERPIIAPNESSITMMVEDTYQISYQIYNGTGSATYSGYDKTIISITDDGFVTAKHKGETTINVCVVANDEEKTSLSYYIKVTVTPIIYYSIRYVSNIDGKRINNDMAKVGSTYEFLSVQNVERYVFKGYSLDKDGKNLIERIEKVDDDTTVYVIYEKDDSNMVEYYVNGEVVKTEFAKKGETINPNEVSCNENNFLGWMDSSKEPKLIENEIVVNGDLKLIALIDKENYSISYDFDGGDWYKEYYTIDELAEMYVKDYNANGGGAQSAIDIDTAHVDSTVFANAYSSKAMLDKWLWLYEALWKQAGSPSGQNPAVGNWKDTSFKSFYISEICGFFTKTQHKDSNFSTRSVDYRDIANQKAILKASTPKIITKGVSSYKKNTNTSLTGAVKNGYTFKGWSFDGVNIITEIKSSYVGDIILKAVWEEAIKPEEFVQTNLPIEGLVLYEPFQLEWDVLPNNAFNKQVYFQSMDTRILTIDDFGNIFPVSKGKTQIRVLFEGNADYELYLDVVVHGKAYFDIAYKTTSYTKVGQDIELFAEYHKNDDEIIKVTWESLTPEVATVNEEGVVHPLSVGTATVRATADGEHIDFVVTVLSETISEQLQFILNNHHSNASLTYNLGIGAGNPVYYYDVVGSVNNLLFDELKYDKTYYDTLKSGEKNYGPMDRVEFITVHYTGSMNYGSDADNMCAAFDVRSYEASIHYVTGRSNLSTYGGDWSIDSYRAFAGLNEAYAGWHASTGRNEAIWDKTGVMFVEGDPEVPVISITDDLYYTINGKKTEIKVPSLPSGYIVKNGVLKVNGKDYNPFNDYGVRTKVVDGEYCLCRTYWGSQSAPQSICTYGGNTNSIGIESCVDKGSDLMHTWHLTAQLVASLLVKYNLGFDRVVGHHFFSGKDCPQPFLRNDMKLWNEFMDMVKAEYELLTKYEDASIKMNIVDGVGIDKLGLLKQTEEAQIVTYEVEITVGGVTEKVTLATSVESIYNCDCLRDEASLQNIGFEIK